MKKRLITGFEIVLEPVEAVNVMHALDYVWHRQRKHQKAGHISTEIVQSLREQLRKAL